MRSTGLRSILVLALILLSAACSSSEAITPVPTLVLIPATATNTRTPITPTATPPSALLPADVAATSAPPIRPADIAPISDNSLVRRAAADLAAALDIPPSSVLVARVEDAVWPNEQLGCDSGGSVLLERAVQGYRVLLVAGSTVYEYHTDATSRVLRCPNESIVSGDILLEVDPVAVDMYEMAQRRLSQELSVSVSRIHLVEMHPVNWTDSSFGCPVPGQTYSPVNIFGYRIVLSDGDKQYIFHTDVLSLFPCTSRQEQLP